MRALTDKTRRIADRQHGRVARRQLLEAGVDRNRISRWIAEGRLIPVHREVYAVGHAAASVHDYVAAVLASGSGAVLSHWSAAHMLRLTGGTPPPPEVTIPVSSGRSRSGVVIHRSRLPTLDVCRFDGIPVTIVPRTLLDLAATLASEELARACHEAWVHHRTGVAQIDACIARNPTKKGIANLRRALGADVTLSALESGFLALLAAHGLPRPRTNIDNRGDKVDGHWPAHGLTVELLSFRFHASRYAFEADVARRRRSQHVAYTYGDVFERASATVADLRPRLAAPTR